LRGDGARLRLRREADARRALCWGTGAVDSLDSQQGAASCLALVAPPPPPSAGEGTGQARMSSFHHVGEASSISPPAGGLSTAIVAVARRGNEYHVVAAVEGHELKTPETEHHPGLERLLETAHLELDGKLFVNTQQAPTCPYSSRRTRATWRVPMTLGWATRQSAPRAHQQGSTHGRCTTGCATLHTLCSRTLTQRQQRPSSQHTRIHGRSVATYMAGWASDGR
jgi:hypothetical protein